MASSRPHATTAATAAGAALPRPVLPVIARRAPALAVAGVCALVAILMALNGSDASLVRQADEAGAAGRYDEAIRLAEQVRSAPADARALVAIARAHTAAGRLRQADRAWAAAAARDPNNWQVHFEWARALALGGRLEQALPHYDRARELNPRLPSAT